MKTLYQVNLTLVLINGLLFLIPMLGMVFMMPLGLVQLLSSFWLSTQQKKTTVTVQRMITIHLILSFIIIGVMFFLANDNHNLTSDTVEVIFTTGMIFSAILAVYFVFITYANGKKQEPNQSLNKELQQHV